MLTFFLLLACTDHGPTIQGGEVLSGLDSEDPTDTSSTSEDTAPDTDTSVPDRLLQVGAESFRCSPGEYLDTNLTIPTEAVVQSFLLLEDGSGGFFWLVASDGVVLWDGGGGADLSCSWSPGPAGVDLFWPGYADQVVAVRVAWAAWE
jgi:hypothetical protein